MRSRLLRTEEDPQFLIEDYQEIVRALVADKIDAHPMPWHPLASGEVHDANNVLVVRFGFPHFARALVECAENLVGHATDADHMPLFSGLAAVA